MHQEPALPKPPAHPGAPCDSLTSPSRAPRTQGRGNTPSVPLQPSGPTDLWWEGHFSQQKDYSWDLLTGTALVRGPRFKGL